MKVQRYLRRRTPARYLLHGMSLDFQIDLDLTHLVIRGTITEPDLISCYLGNPVAANGECFGPDELFCRSAFRKRLDRLYPLALAEWRQNERRV